MSLSRDPKRRFQLPSTSPANTARDIDDELALHLAYREAEYRNMGMTERQAREEAQRRFGDVVQTRGELVAAAAGRARARRLREFLQTCVSDAVLGIRGLRRDRSFSLVALVTLVIGFGAASAVAAVARRYLVSPLPIPGAERLHALDLNNPRLGFSLRPNIEHLAAWRTRPSAYERLEVLHPDQRLLQSPDRDSTVSVTGVTPGLLDYLKVQAIVGRRLASYDTLASSPLVAVLPWRVWQERYGGRRDVVGSFITLDHERVEIVGVFPRAFDLSAFGFGDPPHLWLPYRAPKERTSLYVLGVPRRGASAASLAAALDGVKVEGEDGEIDRLTSGLKARATPLPEMASGRRSVLLVLIMALGVLVIACFNVAHLLLARGATRTRELTIRAALGAQRGRLIRQLLTESAVLAMLATIGGLAVAELALRLARTNRPVEFAALDGLHIDARVVLLAFGLAGLAATFFGILPALLTTRAGLAVSIRSAARNTTAGRGVERLRALLAASEVAISMALLVGAGLLAKSTWRLYHMPLGYSTTGLVSASVTLPSSRHTTPEARRAATVQLLNTLRNVPGVNDLTVAGTAPHVTSGCFCQITRDGDEPTPAGKAKFLQQTTVDSSYFRVLGIPVLTGGTFSRLPGAREIIISRSTAAKYWPGKSAIGERIRLSADDSLRTIVGVVGDMRTPDGFQVDDTVQIYLPREDASLQHTILVRTRDDPSALLGRLAKAVVAFDPLIGIRQLTTEEAEVRVARARLRFTMTVFAIFGAIAVLLAAAGLYGVLAYGVEQRRSEYGVRMAMGATRGAILRRVLRQGAVSTVLGLAIGTGAAGVLARAMSDLLFDTKPSDVGTYIAIASLLVGTALFSMIIPARRATAVDPAVILRAEV